MVFLQDSAIPRSTRRSIFRTWFRWGYGSVLLRSSLYLAQLSGRTGVGLERPISFRRLAHLFLSAQARLGFRSSTKTAGSSRVERSISGANVSRYVLASLTKFHRSPTKCV